MNLLFEWFVRAQATKCSGQKDSTRRSTKLFGLQDAKVEQLNEQINLKLLRPELLLTRLSTSCLYP